MPDTAISDDSIGTHHLEQVGELRLHWVERGRGPLVVLLHGFPQHWLAWRHQIPALAEGGFRVVALDLRGYNLSDKPLGVGAYAMDRLLGDVVALVRHLGETQARIVGHDWGGVVAWHLAAREPELVEKLAIINAPHPARFSRLVRTFDQLRRSWYVLAFQLPRLPEQLIRANDFALIERVLRHDPRRKGAFGDEDIRRHKDALRQPGALTAMVNYYRAAMRHSQPMAARGRVEAPTLVIWGDADRHLRPENADGLERWVPRLEVHRLPGVSHWVMQEEPARVNALLLDFLR